MSIIDDIMAYHRIRALVSSEALSSCIPLIAVTINARQEHIAHIMSESFDDVITKSFRLPALIIDINRGASRGRLENLLIKDGSQWEGIGGISRESIKCKNRIFQCSVLEIWHNHFSGHRLLLSKDMYDGNFNFCEITWREFCHRNSNQRLDSSGI